MSKADFENRESFDNTIAYFRLRGGVLFISYCRFWEKHGFVQQSLALELARNGIPVTWLDGAGWRCPVPHNPEPHASLTVRPLPQLPLTRFAWIRRLDEKRKAKWVRSLLAKNGRSPVVWVQGGTDEALAASLPYIDVFSVFDDLYRHLPGGPLCQRSKVVVTQTESAAAYLRPSLGEKVHSLLPPMDLSTAAFTPSPEAVLPPDFPQTRLGYVGSFFSQGFDFDLFESFIRANAQWGFILQGRTDEEGHRRLRDWEKYPNFHYFPWVPRKHLASVWKLLSVSLLFYRENASQDGAFPVKLVESLRFGIPCVATRVVKTSELEGMVVRGSRFAELQAAIEGALQLDAATLEKQYEALQKKTDPAHHLAQIKRWCEAS